jgi:hypothetical protein
MLIVVKALSNSDGIEVPRPTSTTSDRASAGGINAMYLDKLNGCVEGLFYDKMLGQWRDEQSRCLSEIARLRPTFTNTSLTWTKSEGII